MRECVLSVCVCEQVFECVFECVSVFECVFYVFIVALALNLFTKRNAPSKVPQLLLPQRIPAKQCSRTALNYTTVCGVRTADTLHDIPFTLWIATLMSLQFPSKFALSCRFSTSLYTVTASQAYLLL